MSQIKAKTVILFDMVHKAAKLHLENQLIVSSCDEWKGPYGMIKVSPLRKKIMKLLPKGDYQVNDPMQSITAIRDGVVKISRFTELQTPVI